MGEVTKQDLAILPNVLFELAKIFEVDAEAADGWDRLLLLMARSFSLSAFGGLFRGFELLMQDLGDMRDHLAEGSSPDDHGGYVIICLRGRFKGKHGEHSHMTPLAAESRSGFKFREAVVNLVEHLEGLRIVRGPLYRGRAGGMIKPEELQKIILDRLQRIKDSRPDLIDAKTDVYVEYGIQRSFRCVATTHAQNMGVKDLDIEHANQWRNFWNAHGKKLSLSMIQHYSDVKQL